MNELLTKQQVEDLLMDYNDDPEDFFEYADGLEVFDNEEKKWDKKDVVRFIYR